MHLRVQGHQTEIEAHVLGWIAEWLGDLNAPHNDIFSAEIMLTKHKRRIETRAELVLAGKTLGVTQRRKTQDEAVQAALHVIERQLGAFRNQRRLRQEGMARTQGRITQLCRDRRSGIIETDAHQQVYFHALVVQGMRYERLHLNMGVTLDLESDQSGAHATRVMPRWALDFDS